MIVAASVAAFGFASLAYAGARLSAVLCAGIAPFADGPRPGTPPTPVFVVAAAVVGASLALRHAGSWEFATTAVLSAALAACCYSDIACGLVPDWFTLAPLALLAGVPAAARNAGPLVASLVVALPFALAALLSRGRGLGWGDVKLAALSGAVVGIGTSIAAFAAACLVAALVAVVRRKRDEPIALVPYLAGSIAVALVTGAAS